MAIKKVQLDAIAALTIGVLTENKSQLGPEEANCILTIQSAIPESPLLATIVDICKSLSIPSQKQ